MNPSLDSWMKPAQEESPLDAHAQAAAASVGMKERAIWYSPGGVPSRMHFAEAVNNDAKLTGFAREVGAELSKTLRRDGVAQTSITRIARKLETVPNVVGRAMGQLRARGFVDGERHPDGISCLMPANGKDVINAWFGKAA